MKIYRIKIDNLIYVKAVLIGADGLACIITYEKSNAAWFEEDKAIKYCEALNNNKSYIEEGLKFSLEAVEPGDDR